MKHVITVFGILAQYLFMYYMLNWVQPGQVHWAQVLLFLGTGVMIGLCMVFFLKTGSQALMGIGAYYLVMLLLMIYFYGPLGTVWWYPMIFVTANITSMALNRFMKQLHTHA